MVNYVDSRIRVLKNNCPFEKFEGCKWYWKTGVDYND